MKKKVILVVASLLTLIAMLLTACGNGQVKPLPVKGSSEAGNTMKDGSYHAKFTGEDLSTNSSDKLCLHAEYFQYDSYDKKKFEKLKVGDTYKTHDSEIKITKLIPIYDNTGAQTGVNINGEIEEGGHSYMLVKEDNAYREIGFDDSYMLYSIGSTTLNISKDVKFEDRTVLADPAQKLRDDEIYHYGDLKDCLTGSEFAANNTIIEIKNNEIVSIIQEWVP